MQVENTIDRDPYAYGTIITCSYGKSIRIWVPIRVRVVHFSSYAYGYPIRIWDSPYAYGQKYAYGTEQCDAPRVHLVCEMEQFHYEALYAYLSKGEYPSYYDANKKRILRRKAENFKIDNGELFM